MENACGGGVRDGGVRGSGLRGSGLRGETRATQGGMNAGEELVGGRPGAEQHGGKTSE